MAQEVGCPLGYTGDYCDIDVDECLIPDICGSGVCLNSIGNYICQCAEGYVGPTCREEQYYEETEITTDPTDTNQLLNTFLYAFIIILILVILLGIFLSSAVSDKFKQSNLYRNMRHLVGIDDDEDLTRRANHGPEYPPPQSRYVQHHNYQNYHTRAAGQAPAVYGQPFRGQPPPQAHGQKREAPDGGERRKKKKRGGLNIPQDSKDYTPEPYELETRTERARRFGLIGLPSVADGEPNKSSARVAARGQLLRQGTKDVGPVPVRTTLKQRWKKTKGVLAVTRITRPPAPVGSQNSALDAQRMKLFLESEKRKKYLIATGQYEEEPEGGFKKQKRMRKHKPKFKHISEEKARQLSLQREKREKRGVYGRAASKDGFKDAKKEHYDDAKTPKQDSDEGKHVVFHKAKKRHYVDAPQADKSDLSDSASGSEVSGRSSNAPSGRDSIKQDVALSSRAPLFKTRPLKALSQDKDQPSTSKAVGASDVHVAVMGRKETSDTVSALGSNRSSVRAAPEEEKGGVFSKKPEKRPKSKSPAASKGKSSPARKKSKSPPRKKSSPSPPRKHSTKSPLGKRTPSPRRKSVDGEQGHKRKQEGAKTKRRASPAKGKRKNKRSDDDGENSDAEQPGPSRRKKKLSEFHRDSDDEFFSVSDENERVRRKLEAYSGPTLYPLPD